MNGEIGDAEGGATGEEPLQAPISYLQELTSSPKIVYVGKPGWLVVGGTPYKAIEIDPETGAMVGVEPLETTAELEAVCGTGTVATPTAKPGFLCVYAKTEEGIQLGGLGKLEQSQPSTLWISPSPKNGAIVPFVLKEPAFGFFTGFSSPAGRASGSWALSK